MEIQKNERIILQLGLSIIDKLTVGAIIALVLIGVIVILLLPMKEGLAISFREEMEQTRLLRQIRDSIVYERDDTDRLPSQ